MVKNDYATLIPKHDHKLYVRSLNTHPIWREKPPSKKVLMPKEKLELVCAGSGWPRPVVRWVRQEEFFGMRELSFSDLVRKHASSASKSSTKTTTDDGPTVYETLKLTPNQLTSISTNMTCLVINKNGKIHQTTEIILRKLPKMVQNFRIIERKKGAREIELLWDNDVLADFYRIRFREMVRCESASNTEVGRTKSKCSGNLLDFIVFDNEKFEPSPTNSGSWTYNPNIAHNRHTITNLQPYTFYQIEISAINKVGASFWTPLFNSKLTRTKTEKPENAPVLVSGVYENDRINFRWEMPGSNNGLVLGYNLAIYEVPLFSSGMTLEKYFEIYENQKPKFKEHFIKSHQLTYTLKDFKKQNLYLCKINYENTEGQSNFSNLISVVTDDRFSRQLRVVAASGQSHSKNPITFEGAQKSVIFKNLPILNGEIKFILKKFGGKNEIFSQKFNLGSQTSYTWVDDRILANSTYLVSWQYRDFGKEYFSPPVEWGRVMTLGEGKC